MRSQKEVDTVIGLVCSGLRPLFPRDRMDAILFGSYARGEASADSDIDVMILVDSPRNEISRKTWEIGGVAADILLSRGVVVSPIVENREYFQRNASLFPLYRNILREGVRYRA